MEARALKPRAWLWLLPLALAPALIWGCWHAPFLRLDDTRFLARNPQLALESSWLEVWQVHPAGHCHYFPLTLLSWRLDRLCWGAALEGALGQNAWPAGIRLTNLLLHLCAAWCVWGILRALGARERLAGFVTTAFALHPTVCESVGWPIERSTVLAAALGLAACLCYVRAQSWRGYLGAVVLYAAALLAKPSALNLFAVLAVWEFLGRPRFDAPEAAGAAFAPAPPCVSQGLPSAAESGVRAGARFLSWLRSIVLPVVLRLAPWAVLSAAGVVLTLQMFRANILPPPGGSLWTALLTDVVVLLRYIWNFLWPGGLSAYYGIAPVTRLADARLWTDGAGLALLLAGSLAVARPGARRAMLLAWLWFVGGLGTNLNVVGINDLMHDRFAYIASMGFWLVIGLSVRETCARLRPTPLVGGTLLSGADSAAPSGVGRTLLSGAALALIATVWALCSASRSYLYGETFALLCDAALKEPHSAYAQIFLSDELRFAGDTLRGEAERAVAAGQPALARELGEKADTQYAVSRAHLEAGVRAPDFDRYLYAPTAYVNLAYLYYLQGHDGEALAALDQALSPAYAWRIEVRDVATARGIQGQIALRRRQPKEALEYFSRALELNPAASSLHLHKARALAALQDACEQHGDAARARVLHEAARQELQLVAPGAPAYLEAQDLLRKLQPPRDGQ